MRILFTNTGPWGTGSFSAIESISRKLKKEGHRVKIFFPDNGFVAENKDKYYKNPEDYAIWQFPIQKDDIKIPYFPLMLPGMHPRANDQFYTLKNFSKQEFKIYLELLETKLSELISSYRPDIIESQHIWAFGYALAKLKQVYILCAHNSDQIAFNYDTRMQKKAEYAAKNAKLIFAVSERTKNLVMDLYGIKSEKIIVFPNSHDEEKFKPLNVDRNKILKLLHLDIPLDAKIVCFAGLKTHIKGIDILLKANRLLNPKDNIHLILFGSGDINDVLGPDEINDACFDRVHNLNYQVPEILVQAYNIADLFVLPSRNECGVPISILEAMATGLPAVCADGYGTETMIVGALFKNGDPISLAQAITKIIKLPKLNYQLLRQQALEKAKEYSTQKMLKARLHYYNLLLDTK